MISAVAENWTRACDRLIELIEANELAQMNTADLQTYSKLIVELDSAIHEYKRAIAKFEFDGCLYVDPIPSLF